MAPRRHEMSKRQCEEGSGFRSNNWGRGSDYEEKFSSFGLKVDRAEDLTVKHGKSSGENWASTQSSVMSSCRRSHSPTSWSNKSWSWGQSACPPPLRSPWSSGYYSPSSDWSGGGGGGGRGGSNGGGSWGGSPSKQTSSWGGGGQSWRGSGGGSGGSQYWRGGSGGGSSSKKDDDMARFSGMSYGDVMKITVHQEMEKLNMLKKEEPVNLSSNFKKEK